MARDITAAMQAASAAGTIRPVWFVSYQLSDLTYTRLWSGLGDKSWNGYTWTGAGNLMEISSIAEEANMAASGAAIILSGVPSATISQALSSFRHGLPVDIWLGLENTTTLALLADPYQVFSGYTDAVEILEDGDNSSITMTAENKLIRLQRATFTRYTPESQKGLVPGDLGFDFVPSLANSVLEWA